MTDPREENPWPSHQSPTPQNGRHAEPDTPTTGPVVSYNAAAFDDEQPETTTPSGSTPSDSTPHPSPASPDPALGANQGQQPAVAPPTAPSFPEAPPVPGPFVPPASGVPTGATPGVPTGATPGVPSGAVPASGGPISTPQPATGSFGYATSQYPAAQAGPGGPHNGPQGGPSPQNAHNTPYVTGAQYGPGGPAGPGGPGGLAGSGGTRFAGPGGAFPAGPGRRRGKKPLWFGLGALALVGALVAGYFVFFTFSGIENSNGKISNAEVFAQDATAIWEDSLPEEGITVGSQAGCYYVLNSNKKITNEIACGPALRAGAEPDRVWDFYQFTVSGSGDEQVAEGLSENPTLSRSAPQNGSIVDVEGNEPNDGSGLAAPALPRADENGVWIADQFTVVDDAQGTTVQLDADPRLIAPGAQVIVEQIAEHDSVTIDGLPKQAAADQKLLVISVNGDAGPVSGELNSALRVDLDGTEITVLDNPAGIGATELLISVPDEGDSYLVLETEGHQQLLDLATGERVMNATTEIYYTGEEEPAVELAEEISLPVVSVSEAESLGLDVTFTAARMTPYLQGHGWAPQDQHWLIVDISHAGTTNLGGESTFHYYTIDCSASLVSLGETQSCKSDTGGQNTATWIATVDVGTTYFAVSFEATMDAWGDEQDNVVFDFEPTQLTFSFD